MAIVKTRIYELLNKAVLTVTDLLMVDKNGDAEASNITGQQIVDLVQDNTGFTDLQDVPTDYTGEGGKYVMVSMTEDGLVFNTIAVSDTNIYNSDGTLTANRTVNLDSKSLTWQVGGALAMYIVGNANNNFYVNQSGAGNAIFAQSTTGFAGDFLGGNGTAVRIQSQSVGLNSSGNAIGGFFKPLAAGGTALWAVQDVGLYAAQFFGTTKGKLNISS
jgi:hypothetical protein